MLAFFFIQPYVCEKVPGRYTKTSAVHYPCVAPFHCTNTLWFIYPCSCWEALDHFLVFTVTHSPAVGFLIHGCYWAWAAVCQGWLGVLGQRAQASVSCPVTSKQSLSGCEWSLHLAWASKARIEQWDKVWAWVSAISVTSWLCDVFAAWLWNGYSASLWLDSLKCKRWCQHPVGFLSRQSEVLYGNI